MSMNNFLYRLSRIWNSIVLNVALFCINIVWDKTGMLKKSGIINDAFNETHDLKEISGVKSL